MNWEQSQQSVTREGSKITLHLASWGKPFDSNLREADVETVLKITLCMLLPGVGFDRKIGKLAEMTSAERNGKVILSYLGKK